MMYLMDIGLGERVAVWPYRLTGSPCEFRLERTAQVNCVDA
jgi:hypothetical protein